jgi:hypothetical protein
MRDPKTRVLARTTDSIRAPFGLPITSYHHESGPPSLAPRPARMPSPWHGPTDLPAAPWGGLRAHPEALSTRRMAPRSASAC